MQYISIQRLCNRSIIFTTKLNRKNTLTNVALSGKSDNSSPTKMCSLLKIKLYKITNKAPPWKWKKESLEPYKKSYLRQRFACRSINLHNFCVNICSFDRDISMSAKTRISRSLPPDKTAVTISIIIYKNSYH